MAMATTSEGRRTRLAEQRKQLPDGPGVYLFHDAKGKVIYVGKAKSLKKRVASHFSNPVTRGAYEMVDSIDSVEFLLVSSEAEALLAEQNFIKQYRPRFNIRLRDDKSYPFIAISMDEDYPRVYFTRERHRRNRLYFGPYSNAKRVRGTLDLLAKVFLFRSCQGVEPGRRSGSPCLDYYIKRCGAPCVGYVTRDEYMESINGVTAFLSGRYREIERDLEQRMKAAAEAQEFEQAALHRNRLRSVRSLLERQRVANEAVGTVDAIAVAVDGADANAQVFQIRDGVLSDRHSFYLANEAEHGEPEVFDISNIGGTHTVASMVVFEGGAPKKSDYRRFTIRTVEGSDDFAAMEEVLARRLGQWERQADISPHDREYDPGFAALPNVVVVDGGKGQLSSGLRALRGFRERGVVVIALAKRIEEVFLPGAAAPLVLDHDTP